MNDLPRVPIGEPNAWTAAELRQDPSWILRWTEAEKAELDRAAADILARGLAVPGFTRDDVEMPLLAAKATEIRRALDDGRGAVLLKGLDVRGADNKGRDRREVEAIYWAIGVYLGLPIHQNGQGERIIEVLDRGEDYNQPKTRGYTNRSGLKFHCDGCDVVGLLCLHPAKTGGVSYICSALALYNDILANNPEYLAPLGDGFFGHLRGEGVTTNPDEITRHRVPVFSQRDGKVSCRFIRKTILDGQRVAGAPLSGVALEAIEHFAALAEDDRFRFEMDFEPGDIQLLNNHVTLHARSDYQDWPDDARKRRLLRLWINQPDGRPIVDALADRYNTGVRQPMTLEKDRLAWSESA